MSKPIWQPNLTTDSPLICDFIDHVNKAHNTNLARDNFLALHDWSIKNLEEFWTALWDFHGVIGHKGNAIITPINTVPYARFFDDSKLSYAENMLTHWITNPDQNAIIYRHQNSADRIINGKQLYDGVSLWEQALRNAGITKDDVVGVYLTNTPETDIILLAAGNIGAIFCSAGMEMGGDDLAGRFNAVKPKILITAEGYLHGEKIIDRREIIASIKEKIPSIKTIIHIPIPGSNRDDNPLKNLSPQPIKFQRHAFNHPLYILFSSGTTGVPKCFVHSSGGVLLKHISEYKLQTNIRENDVTFYHATPSWMMWNWASSALAIGATVLKYDGNPFYPDASTQLKFTADHNCTQHGTAAPVIMAWRDQNLDVTNTLDLSSLRTIMYTGAVLPEQGFTYINSNIKSGVQISGISGGTDLVGCFLSGNPLMPTLAGQIPYAVLGIDLQIWTEEGTPITNETAGELVCANPFPSMPLRFQNDENGERYNDAYFDFYADTGQKVWRHGDTIHRTDQDQYIVVGRSDGTLNQNGVRIGSGALYAQLDPFTEITDACAVDFTRPDTKQSITILFVVTNTLTEALTKAIKTAIRDNVGPYSIPTEIIQTPGVLRTKNGKLAEVVTKKILANNPPPNPDLYGAELVEFYKTIATELQDKYS